MTSRVPFNPETLYSFTRMKVQRLKGTEIKGKLIYIRRTEEVDEGRSWAWMCAYATWCPFQSDGVRHNQQSKHHLRSVTTNSWRIARVSTAGFLQWRGWRFHTFFAGNCLELPSGQVIFSSTSCPASSYSCRHTPRSRASASPAPGREDQHDFHPTLQLSGSS